MKEIQILLEKINQLSSGNAYHSAIDLDLMMDYTRRIYDLLLSERFKNQTHHTDVVHNFIVDEGKEIKEQNQSLTQTEGTKTEAAFAHLTASSSSNNIISETTTQEVQELDREAFQPETEKIKANEQFLQQEKLTPEKEPVSNWEQNSISFEPPQPPEEQPVFPEEGIEEEKPEERDDLSFLDKVPTPVQEEDILSDYAQIFHYNAASSDRKAADIRKQIGINDKYLFLNELFNSQKKIYENTLDQLNEFSDYKEASNWINKEVATAFKWENEDETVQDFYSVLQKYFSER